MHRSSVGDSTCRVTDLSIELCLFFSLAAVIQQRFPSAERFAFRTQLPEDFLVAHPRLRIDGRIVYRHHKFDLIRRDAAVTLFEPHLVAVGISEEIKPRPLIM